MLQEILHNTIKHAGAREFSVDARIEGQELFIEIRDDGRGFDLSAAQEKGGLGLQNILVRARMIGARMEITTSPGTGTCYSIQLPINEDHTTNDSSHPGHPGR